MLAFLQLSTNTTLGYLCVVAGFLIIVASVAFVTKGQAVLDQSGAPNAFEWGGKKVSLTSAVALFVLGAALIALPLWLFNASETRQRDQEAKMQEERARQPAKALLTGKINGRGRRDVRLLLVVKPDYDQTYRGEFTWQIPLLATKTSYSIIYIDGDAIVGQQSFSVAGVDPGSPDQTVSLPPWDLQTDSSATPVILPNLEVSDAEIKSLAIR